MSDFNLSDFTAESSDGLSAAELLDTNWQTTAAVGVTLASGGVAGAIMLAAFPAQTLVASGTIAGLAYAGKRRADGLSPIPFTDKKDDSKSPSDTASEEAAPAAA